MDIKSNIKKRVSDKIREASRKSSKWNSEEHPNIYELEKFLDKSGYRLLDIIEHDKNGRTIPELLIAAKDPSYLYPEITHDLTADTFMAQTKSYGDVDKSDLEEVIKGYQNALGVLEYLDNLNLSSLEYTDEGN